MKTEKQVKEIAKRFYTFCNKYVNKSQTSKIELTPGVIATIEYDVYVDDACIDINNVSLKVSKEAKAFAELLALDLEHHVLNMDLDDRIDINPLVDQYQDLLNEMNEAIYGDDEDNYENYMRDFTESTLTDFYETVLELVKEFKKSAEQKAIEVRFKLTDDYTAIINKPHGRIHVGCQRIPIEKVRELVKLYDEA